MNIDLQPQHEAFRDEVRRFLDESLTDELRQAQRFCPGLFLDYEHNIRWHRILHRKGWVAPAWPERFGGPGWDLLQRYIWTTESTLAGAPTLAPMGLGMCGPMLIGCGSPQQQAEYLPRILSGEDYWCQGYSEPGSGSDLASLALKATVDGDALVLSGTKIWTTHAHVANRMFALVRSDDSRKPQQGITFVLLDMASPGITVEPILFASGTHEVNQVFFDEVRVPLDQVVGGLHEGWRVAKYLLEFERGGGGSASQRSALRRIARLAGNTASGSGGTLAQDPAFADKLANAELQLAALQAVEFRVMASLASGASPGPESSMLKTLGANAGQRLTELAVEAIDHAALAHQPQARTVGSNVPVIGPVEGVVAFPRYFNLRASSIAGGSNEVQKNIMAKLVLGL
ncbi:MAG: acyl-CoA dehydrogenase family protein [Pseudomonadota bacterium]